MGKQSQRPGGVEGGEENQVLRIEEGPHLTEIVGWVLNKFVLSVLLVAAAWYKATHFT